MTDASPNTTIAEETWTDVDRQITAASLEIVNAEKRLASTFELWCSTTTAEDEVSEGRSASFVQAYGTLLRLLEAPPETHSSSFVGHIVRAEALRAEIVQLLHTFFADSLTGARHVWGEVSLASCDLHDTSSFLEKMKVSITERRQSLERLVRASESCRNLLLTVLKELRPLIVRKLDRQDTFQHLGECELNQLKKQARCWLDDVAKMTDDMDENLKIPSVSIGRVAFTLLSTQKRFLYALMDSVESCLQLRLSWLVNVRLPNYPTEHEAANGECIEIKDTVTEQVLPPLLQIHFGPMLQHLDDLAKFFPFPLLLGLHLDKISADQLSALTVRSEKPQEEVQQLDVDPPKTDASDCLRQEELRAPSTLSSNQSNESGPKQSQRSPSPLSGFPETIPCQSSYETPYEVSVPQASYPCYPPTSFYSGHPVTPAMQTPSYYGSRPVSVYPNRFVDADLSRPVRPSRGRGQRRRHHPNGWSEQHPQLNVPFNYYPW